MSLIDTKAIEKIEIDNDWYELRQELGFYEKKLMQEAAFTFEFPSNFDGRDMSKVKAVPNHAERDLSKLKQYLVAWSYPDKLDDDNIKRLPQAHADKLLERIKELEAATPRPFRGQPKTA